MLIRLQREALWDAHIAVRSDKPAFQSMRKPRKSEKIFKLRDYRKSTLKVRGVFIVDFAMIQCTHSYQSLHP